MLQQSVQGKLDDLGLGYQRRLHCGKKKKNQSEDWLGFIVVKWGRKSMGRGKDVLDG